MMVQKMAGDLLSSVENDKLLDAIAIFHLL